MKNIILIAPPAAGKGTLANLLADRLGYISLSTGDMLREKAKTDFKLQEELKTGKLISDEVVIAALEEKLDKIDSNYILDGFPRTINQAVMYQELMEKRGQNEKVVIYLDVPKEELLKRVTTRVICPTCKKTYSTINEVLMPQEEGLCDDCKISLITRSDDTPEVFSERYEEYLNKTAPLIDFYEKDNVLFRISAIDSEDTYQRVLKLIK